MMIATHQTNAVFRGQRPHSIHRPFGQSICRTSPPLITSSLPRTSTCYHAHRSDGVSTAPPSARSAISSHAAASPTFASASTHVPAAAADRRALLLSTLASSLLLALAGEDRFTGHAAAAAEAVATSATAVPAVGGDGPVVFVAGSTGQTGRRVTQSTTLPPPPWCLLRAARGRRAGE